jgi:3',5'-cyclic AMP phosphodiesterase CpdA
MRIVHVTDLHVERVPAFGACLNKRAAGAVNLYVLGRHHHFTRQSQEALVAAVGALEPDVVLCTGDLTVTATEAEFVAAAELVAPLRTRFDWLAIPGNHDVYTDESVGRFARHFGEVAPVRVERRGAWDLVLVDVCHPDWLSRGWLGAAGLEALEAALAGGDRPALVALHYPLRNRRGERYGPATRACIDAEAIEAACVRHARVRFVCHGHEHHGFRTVAPRAGDDLPILDPGAGGYAFLPERGRTAHFAVYTLDATGLVDVARHAFDGASFVPEAGGAFASGR